MTTLELAGLLAAMGCPAGKSDEMASQLEKRALQLAGQKNRTYDEALVHLLSNASLRAAMGARGEALVRRRYSSEAVTNELIRVYNDVARPAEPCRHVAHVVGRA